MAVSWLASGGCQDASELPDLAVRGLGAAVPSMIDGPSPIMEPEVANRSLETSPENSSPTHFRTRIANLGDELARIHSALVSRFGDAEVIRQSTHLGSGHYAHLFEKPGGVDPLIIVTDQDGNELWSKQRPTVGMVDGVRLLTIAPGKDRGVGFFFYAPQPMMVAARTWAEDGSIIADFPLIEIEHVVSIATLYVPGQGTLISATGDTKTIGQRLDESGRLRWGAGRDFTSHPSGVTQTALVDLGQETTLWLGYRDGDAPSLFAVAIDGEGEPIWSKTITGDVPASATIAARVEADVAMAEWRGADGKSVGLHVITSGAEVHFDR